MGASALEIERQIKETRDRMDEKLTRLERRATAGAVRYGRIAAVVVGVAALAGVGILVYRRMHRPALRDRLDDLSFDHLRTLAAQLTAHVKEQLPSVTVRINEKTQQEPGTVESILRKVAPALVGTAGSALLDRVVKPREDTYDSSRAE